MNVRVKADSRKPIRSRWNKTLDVNRRDFIRHVSILLPVAGFTGCALRSPRDTGSIGIDESLCVGCGACIEAWGLLTELQGFSQWRSMQINHRAGFFYGSGEDPQTFSPVFERIRWGERQRYRPRQGRIGLLSQSLRFDGVRWLELGGLYARHWDRNRWEGISDALDFSTKVTMMKRHHFWLTGTALNLSTDSPTYQIKVASRVLL